MKGLGGLFTGRRGSLTKKPDETNGKADETRIITNADGTLNVVFLDHSEIDFMLTIVPGSIHPSLAEVRPKSTAALMGLGNGDKVLKINDHDTGKLAFQDCNAFLAQPPVTLTIEKLKIPVALPIPVYVATAPLDGKQPMPPPKPAQAIGVNGQTMAPLKSAQTSPFTGPIVGARYDVLHKVPIDAAVRSALAPPGAEYPPEPKTGWRWRPCVVENVAGDNRVSVIFEDNLIAFGYPRQDTISVGDSFQYLAPSGLKSPGHIMHHSYRSDDILDVLDIYAGKHTGKEQRKWRKCQVVAVAPYFIRVTFCGWDRGYDLWIHTLEESFRLAPFGQHTETEEREESSRETNFRQKMKAKGMEIVDVVPDGNCLFRSVSLLLFGDESRHGDIRKACCDYMESQPKRFEFLVAEGESFQEYVNTMRQDKCWGDEPELRVIEEIYDRPISMYSCDIVGTNENSDPTEPLAHYRVGEEVAGMEDTEPLRLSFHGNNHYNAVRLLAVKPKFDPTPDKNKQRIRRHRLLQNGGSLESVGTLRHHASSFSFKRTSSVGTAITGK